MPRRIDPMEEHVRMFGAGLTGLGVDVNSAEYAAQQSEAAYNAQYGGGSPQQTQSIFQQIQAARQQQYIQSWNAGTSTYRPPKVYGPVPIRSPLATKSIDKANEKLAADAQKKAQALVKQLEIQKAAQAAYDLLAKKIATDTERSVAMKAASDAQSKRASLEASAASAAQYEELAKEKAAIRAAYDAQTKKPKYSGVVEEAWRADVARMKAEGERSQREYQIRQDALAREYARRSEEAAAMNRSYAIVPARGLTQDAQQVLARVKADAAATEKEFNRQFGVENSGLAAWLSAADKAGFEEKYGMKYPETAEEMREMLSKKDYLLQDAAIRAKFKEAYPNIEETHSIKKPSSTQDMYLALSNPDIMKKRAIDTFYSKKPSIVRDLDEMEEVERLKLFGEKARDISRRVDVNAELEQLSSRIEDEATKGGRYNADEADRLTASYRNQLEAKWERNHPAPTLQPGDLTMGVQTGYDKDILEMIQNAALKKMAPAFITDAKKYRSADGAYYADSGEKAIGDWIKGMAKAADMDYSKLAQYLKGYVKDAVTSTSQSTIIRAYTRLTQGSNAPSGYFDSSTERAAISPAERERRFYELARTLNAITMDIAMRVQPAAFASAPLEAKLERMTAEMSKPSAPEAAPVEIAQLVPSLKIPRGYAGEFAMHQPVAVTDVTIAAQQPSREPVKISADVPQFAPQTPQAALDLAQDDPAMAKWINRELDLRVDQYETVDQKMALAQKLAAKYQSMQQAEYARKRMFDDSRRSITVETGGKLRGIGWLG